MAVQPTGVPAVRRTTSSRRCGDGRASSPGYALAVSGPAGVTALVLAEAVSGGLALLFLTPLWSEVRRGFFTLTGGVLLVLSFATWGAAAAGSVPASEAGEWSVRLSAALALVCLVWIGLMFVKRHAAARVGGIVSVP